MPDSVRKSLVTSLLDLQHFLFIDLGHLTNQLYFKCGKKKTNFSNLGTVFSQICKSRSFLCTFLKK